MSPELNAYGSDGFDQSDRSQSMQMPVGGEQCKLFRDGYCEQQSIERIGMRRFKRRLLHRMFIGNRNNSCPGLSHEIAVLVWMYVRLAHSEEREVVAELGDAYRRYADGVPAFIPRLSRLSGQSSR